SAEAVGSSAWLGPRYANGMPALSWPKSEANLAGRERGVTLIEMPRLVCAGRQNEETQIGCDQVPTRKIGSQAARDREGQYAIKMSPEVPWRRRHVDPKGIRSDWNLCEDRWLGLPDRMNRATDFPKIKLVVLDDQRRNHRRK